MEISIIYRVKYDIWIMEKKMETTGIIRKEPGRQGQSVTEAPRTRDQIANTITFACATGYAGNDSVTTILTIILTTTIVPTILPIIIIVTTAVLIVVTCSYHYFHSYYSCKFVKLAFWQGVAQKVCLPGFWPRREKKRSHLEPSCDDNLLVRSRE